MARSIIYRGSAGAGTLHLLDALKPYTSTVLRNLKRSFNREVKAGCVVIEWVGKFYNWMLHQK